MSVVLLKQKTFISLIALIIVGISVAPIAFAQLTMPIGNNDGIQALVAAAFPDAPEMVTIGECESGLRQFNDQGFPLLGGANGYYVGIFQISEGHDQSAEAMGMDIYSVAGNIAYAKYLYQQEGTSPWVVCAAKAAASDPVASPSPSLVASSTIAAVATSTATGLTMPVSALTTPTASAAGLQLNEYLNLGMNSSQVAVLQKLLNANGFVLTSSGAGSPGNETTLFGGLTLSAVERFQCAKAIVCSGSEWTNGYGRVGPKTLAALNALGAN